MDEYIQWEKTFRIDSAFIFLRQFGLDAETSNNGVHIVAKHQGIPLADIWPTTGKWRLRGRSVSGVAEAGDFSEACCEIIKNNKVLFKEENA